MAICLENFGNTECQASYVQIRIDYVKKVTMVCIKLLYGIPQIRALRTKILISSTILLFFGWNSFCQSNTVLSDGNSKQCETTIDTLLLTEVYTYVDKMPEIEEGMSGLMKNISNNVNPLKAANRLQSKVYVGFVVDKNGNIKGKRVLKDIENSGIGEQVLDQVDSVNWIPGSCNGEKVDVIFILPVLIHLN